MKNLAMFISALWTFDPSASALPVTAPKCAAPQPALREYWVDYGESIVEFSIRFGLARVKGRFTKGDGTILYDSAAPANSSVTMILDTKSLDTGWPHRDEHLRTADFFDVAKYPTIEFRSTRFTPSAGGWLAEGDLTMHGVTKRITMPFHLIQPPARNTQSHWITMNLAGELRLARADFGIFGGSAFNSWFDKARQATMGDSVDVSIEVEAYSPDAASQRSPRIQQAIDLIASKGVEAQIAQFQELKKTKTPAEFEAYYRAADLVTRGLIASCRVADAVAFSKAITALYPDSYSAHLVNGFALSVGGDKRGAATEYAKAKALYRPPVRDPNEKFPLIDNNWWYPDQLARNAWEWGYLDQGVQLARTLAEMYPTMARAHATYGQMLALSGRTKEAAAAYERALQVDPEETRALEWQRRLH